MHALLWNMPHPSYTRIGSTPDVTQTLGQVQSLILCLNMIPMCFLWGRAQNFLLVTAKTSFDNLVTSMPPVPITGFVNHFVRNLTSWPLLRPRLKRAYYSNIFCENNWKENHCTKKKAQLMCYNPVCTKQIQTTKSSNSKDVFFDVKSLSDF